MVGTKSSKVCTGRQMTSRKPCELEPRIDGEATEYKAGGEDTCYASVPT